MIRREMELGQGAHVPQHPGAAGGEAGAHCEEGEEAPGQEQDAAAGSKMHWPQDGQRPPCPAAWRANSAVPTSPQCLQSAPWHHVFLLSCLVLSENWGSGTALSPVVQHVRGETSSQSEKPCLPLGPPALHGIFQGQPLSLNPPNYLCSCCFLGGSCGTGVTSYALGTGQQHWSS